MACRGINRSEARVGWNEFECGRRVLAEIRDCLMNIRLKAPTVSVFKRWFCAMLPRARFDGDSGDLGLQLANGSTATSGKPARPCRPTWCENHVWSSQRFTGLHKRKLNGWSFNPPSGVQIKASINCTQKGRCRDIQGISYRLKGWAEVVFVKPGQEGNGGDRPAMAWTEKEYQITLYGFAAWDIQILSFCPVCSAQMTGCTRTKRASRGFFDAVWGGHQSRQSAYYIVRACHDDPKHEFTSPPDAAAPKSEDHYMANATGSRPQMCFDIPPEIETLIR
ncbi:hypothetical protein DFH09DRAFT_1090131 [Mycena vulgaris]|nr:hypothetical protein DFH09DRAFT_1090131 [Mycena vulgaris]